MKIAFWSNMHGQTATTSNLLAVAIMNTLINQNKNIIIQSHFNMNNLENSLLGITIKDIETYWDTGIDNLIRARKYKSLDKETIENSSISFLDNKLNFLMGTRKENKEDFQKEMLDTISNILNDIEPYYKNIFIDTNAGNSPITSIILKESDIIVMNFSQNINIINQYFKYSLNLYPEKTIFLVGNYDYNSKYSLGNICRQYKINRNQIASIPYNTEFADEQCNGNTIKFLLRNFYCKKDSINYEFITQVKKATIMIDEKIERIKKNVS